MILPVVELTVELVELFHSGDKVCIGGFKQDVVMGAHEAVGMAVPVVFFDDPLHEMGELFPILLVMEDRHPSDAPANDMIHGSRVLNSQGSGHFRSPFLGTEKRSKNEANLV